MTTQGKKKLVLLPSKAMDSNKKKERNENGLIRMPAKARTFMRFDNDKVEIWTAADTDGKNASVLLDVYQAFAADLTALKRSVQKGEISANEANRIGFVTTKMYNRITGGDSDKNIWVSTGVHDTVLGADPEFLLFDGNGNVVRANNVMHKEGVIGCDGAMAEVRPKPATTPEGLVKNITDAFSNKSLTAGIKQYDWVAGCYFKDKHRDFPMGGHIHVGNPAKVARMLLARRETFFNVLNKIMDELVSIPCIRLDGDMGNKRRTDCQMSNGGGGWGWFGEWRSSNGRLEHRTLSGMWLLHPSVAKCVIGTAKAVTDAVFKYWAQHGFEYNYVIPLKYEGYSRSDMNADRFDSWSDFTVCKDLGATMSSRELRAILNNSKGGDINKSFLDKWLSKMKKLETYPKYSKHILGLKEILSVNMSEISGWDRKIQTNWLNGKKFLVDV
jgi:hypothetical protein